MDPLEVERARGSELLRIRQNRWFLGCYVNWAAGIRASVGRSRISGEFLPEMGIGPRRITRLVPEFGVGMQLKVREEKAGGKNEGENEEEAKTS